MRSFTIESIKRTDGKSVNYKDGRFVSETPVASAKKVFTKAYHHLKSTGALSLVVKIRETTQGSLKKEYTYKVRRVAEKTEVERDGKMIQYNFITKAKAV
jgi:hypothetical protein